VESIGPRYGTVDAAWVREAAKEAAGIFVLIVCGFAFDGYLDSELKRLGGLPILKGAMNPDLSMGDEVLKKTASANLFMVFGEPDIDVRREADGWVVEIRGLDLRAAIDRRLCLGVRDAKHAGSMPTGLREHYVTSCAGASPVPRCRTRTANS
jgi:hypothetical protein